MVSARYRAVATSSKPPAGAKSIPQLALGRVSDTDSAVENSSRSTQRGSASARSALSVREASVRATAPTFATPRHDATAADMRRAMMFNDDSDDDDNADRIIRLVFNMFLLLFP